MAAHTASPPDLRRKARGQGASRRGEILEAAKRLFVAEGIGQATMRRIAAAVGVSPTALYVYFPDKDAILRAIAEATFAELLTVLEDATRHGEGSALARLEAGLRAYVAFGRTRPDEYRLTFLTKQSVPSQPGRKAELHGGVIEDADRAFAILEAIMADLMPVAPAWASVPALAVAEAIWACMHGLITLLIDMPGSCGTEPEALTDAAIALVMRGLPLSSP